MAEIRRRFDLVPKYGDGSDVVPSIGVVTFNAQQRAYIEALLRDADDDRLAAALDRADGEGLFVKNLENVQGDERDVVFFSTGFSPNANGDLPLNFGPLNRVGGERRLNVAITRARRQVVVFSSFDPEQLRAEETSSIGIKHLRAYLDLAAQGTDVLPRDARSASVVDRHREEIAAALRERGLVVRTDVGLSEFRVDLSISRPVDPETPVMAVLLDGPAWARRRTVGDRDGLPVEVLSEMLRWPAVERVWLPSWLADPAAVVDHLVASVETVPVAAPAPIAFPTAAVESFKGVAALRSAVTSVAVPAAQPTEGRSRPARSVMDGETAFVPWIPKVAGEKSVLDELPTAKAARAVRKVLNAGIKAEGPIHVDRLTKLTVGAFGLNRSSEARKTGAAVDAAAVGRGRRLPVARGRRPGDVDRVPPAAVEHRPADRPRAAGGDRERDGGAVPGLGRDAPRGAAHPGGGGVRLQAPDAGHDAGVGGGAEVGAAPRPAHRAAERPADGVKGGAVTDVRRRPGDARP